jgi:hypothetical protein
MLLDIAYAMNKTYASLAAVALLSLSGCTFLYSDKTPKGIDVEPVFSVYLDRPFTQTSRLEELIPGAHINREAGFDFIGIDRGGDRRRFEHRSIEFLTFESSGAAQEEYQTDKKNYIEEYRWKLYREAGTSSNRYFSAYKPPWVSAHGTPTVINKPEVLVEYLKGNLIVTVSYNGDKNAAYVRIMNEDISYASDILRQAISPAGVTQ